MMLKLILDRVDPYIRLGIEQLEDEIFEMNLSTFDGDLILLLDGMEELRHQIFDWIDADPLQYEKILFAAILSGTNEEFNTTI